MQREIADNVHSLVGILQYVRENSRLVNVRVYITIHKALIKLLLCIRQYCKNNMYEDELLIIKPIGEFKLTVVLLMPIFRT